MKTFKSYLSLINNMYKRFLIKKHILIKLLNVFMLILSGIMFIHGGIGSVELPNFAKYSEWDIWIWAIVLYSLALIQIVTLLKCDCVISYRWSNTVLIISGFVLLIVGCLFGFKYPPSNWQMTFYPFVGFLLSLVGRQLNKTTQCIKGLKDGKNN